jgi:tetratricopeptide (TPR) repeat protein
MWPDGTSSTAFRFQHALYLKVLYDAIPDSQRVGFHRQIADRLEAGYDGKVNEIAAELANHYRSANEADKAARYFQLAAEGAVQRCAYREGERHYRDALSTLLARPESADRDRAELTIQMALGGISVATQGWAADDTLAVYDRAKTLAARMGSAESADLYFGLWVTALTRGELPAALILSEQMLQIAAAVGPSALVNAYFATGSTHFVLGNLTEGYQLLMQGVNLHKAEDFEKVPYDSGIYSICYAGAAKWLLGYPERAREFTYEGRAWAKRVGKPFVLAHADAFSLADVFRGDFEDTSLACEKAEKLSTEWGFPTYRTASRIFGVWARAQMGRLAEGSTVVKSLRDEADSAQPLFRELMLAIVAETEASIDAIDEAIISLEHALQCNPKELWYRPLTLTLRGRLRLLANSNSIDLAEQDFRDAIELSRKMSAKSPELRATTSLARLLRDTGRRDEARTMLAEIYCWFTEGFDTKDLKEAKALLDELNISARSQPKELQS